MRKVKDYSDARKNDFWHHIRSPLWQHYFPIKVLAFALTNIFMSMYNGIYTYGLVDNVNKRLLVFYCFYISINVVGLVDIYNNWILYLVCILLINVKPHCAC